MNNLTHFLVLIFCSKCTFVLSDCPKAGYEANEDGTAERPCRPGTHKNNTNCEQCKRCPPGEYQNSPGSHYCDVPSIGHYVVNATYEQHCEKGTYKPGKGPALECIKCQAGRYGAWQGADRCFETNVGHQPARFGLGSGVAWVVTPQLR